MLTSMTPVARSRPLTGERSAGHVIGVASVTGQVLGRLLVPRVLAALDSVLPSHGIASVLTPPSGTEDLVCNLVQHVA